jgi:hypothetical protein
MTIDTIPCPPAHLVELGDRQPDMADIDGWQALAVASLGRELSGPELAAVEHLPVDVSLDLLFPDLDDAARHEALWALDGP